MGLIRSGHTDLTPMSETEALTAYLWPIVREMVKTAVENGQNLVVEGCYIPFDWEKDFAPDYLAHIRYVCLVMSEEYIKNHFDDILRHANDIERRLDDDCTLESVLEDNARTLCMARRYGVNCHLIDEGYDVDLNWE